MSTTHSLQRLSLIAAVSLCLLHSPLASVALSQFDVPNSERLAVRDISLGSHGVLRGRLIDRAGRPLQSEIALWRGSDEIARGRSDRSGGFTFHGVGAGVHRLVTNCDVAICRLWAANTAPPAANELAMLYAGAVVRGQCGCQSYQKCNDCCGTYGGYEGGTYESGSSAGVGVPAPPAVSTEELRSFAPDLPDEQFAALTRADVVIVNPEHISMVISYNSVTGTATVVAKGGDELALQIQRVARGAGVPVVRNPPLAQALYAQVGVGQAVPEPLLAQIADMLAELTAAPAFEPGFVGDSGFAGDSGGFQPGINRNFLIGAGIIGAGIAIPVALSNEDSPHDQYPAS